jgi:ABC-type Fe3+ transport system substrate-binding protein
MSEIGQPTPSRRGFLKGGLYAAAGLVGLGATDLIAACGGSGGGGSSSGDDVQQAYDNFVKKEMPGVPISLLRAAKTEGALNAYLLVPDYNKELVQVFQEKFPFITVQASQLNGGALSAKFLAEVRSNQPIADIAQFSSAPDAINAMNQGYVMPYKVSSEAELNLSAGVPGSVYAVTGDLMTICYNPQKIKDSDASATLRKWDGILDSKWNGKSFAVGEVLAGGTTQLLNYYLFKTFGTTVWQRVGKASHAIYPGGNPELDAVMAGEHDMAYGVPQSLAVPRYAKGAPIHWTNPTEWLASPYLQFISAKAKNVNVAKLYQEFIFTPTAQAICTKFGGISYRKGFKATGDFTKQSWYNQPDPAKYWPYTDKDLSAAIPDIAKQWRSIVK